MNVKLCMKVARLLHIVVHTTFSDCDHISRSQLLSVLAENVWTSSVFVWLLIIWVGICLYFSFSCVCKGDNQLTPFLIWQNRQVGFFSDNPEMVSFKFCVIVTLNGVSYQVDVPDLFQSHGCVRNITTACRIGFFFLNSHPV